MWRANEKIIYIYIKYIIIYIIYNLYIYVWISEKSVFIFPLSNISTNIDCTLFSFTCLSLSWGPGPAIERVCATETCSPADKCPPCYFCHNIPVTVNLWVKNTHLHQCCQIHSLQNYIKTELIGNSGPREMHGCPSIILMLTSQTIAKGLAGFHTGKV